MRSYRISDEYVLYVLTEFIVCIDPWLKCSRYEFTLGQQIR
jgi:hypothetical protein